MNAHPEFAKWIPNGYQTRKVREYKRRIPAFAASEESLRRVLLQKYLREYRIAELFWLCNWTSREIAENLDMTPAAVRQALVRLKKRLEV